MRFQTYAIAIGLLFVGLISFTSCDDDNNNSSNIQVGPLVEQNFVDDTSLRASPEEGLVGLFLEPPDAAEQDNLTGELGFDVIPYRYNRTLNHSFCFVNADEGSQHSFSLKRQSGEEIVSGQADGDCVSAMVEPGEYEVVLTHGQHNSRIDPIFLITLPDAQEFTKTKNNKSFLAKAVKSIGDFFTRPAKAQTTDDNVTTLISTNSCVNCDLQGVDLEGADLNFANLTGANLSDASLSGIQLFESTLTNSNFNGSDLSDTNGITALRGSEMSGVDLSFADLTGADIQSAALTSANFTGATITDADFDNANLINATWIDGGTCGVASIGLCNESGGGSTEDVCDSLTIGFSQDFNLVYKCLLPTVTTEVCTTETGGGQDGGGLIETCEDRDPSELVTSADLAAIVDQVNSAFSANIDIDTPIAILAWGGEGSLAADSVFTSGGKGGDGGFASMATTLRSFQNKYGTTSFFFYLAEAGTLSNASDGDGGSSTLVMPVESNPGSPDDIILLAGGGGGGSDAGFFNDGGNGGPGGFASSFQENQSFFGPGGEIIGGADGGSTDGPGIGGDGTNDGQDGIGGEGGSAFQGDNSNWINGDPDVGSDGRGGNADESVSSSGGAGGGGGYGGGGAGDGVNAAGGGSYATEATITCNSAPNNGFIPSSPGTIRDSSFHNSNGAVEVWLFPNGCN